MTDWIVIPSWNKFQHYHDRRPAWIKLYTELASKDEWLYLTLHQRGLLVSLWLEYASSDGQLRLNTASLSRRLGGRVSSVQLKALNDAGFIDIVASRPLALARAREEKETEKERSSELRKPRRSASAGVQPELLGYPEWLATLKQKAAL